MKRQIRNKHTPLRRIVAVSGIAALLLYLFLAWTVSWWPFIRSTSVDTRQKISEASLGDSKKQEDSQQKTDAENKKAYIDSQLKNNGSTITPASTAKVSLTAYQKDGSLVIITTKLVSVSDGTCTLSISSGEKKYILTAEVLYQPEYSMCAGFSVPIDNLGIGIWNLTLNVTSNSNLYSAESTVVVR